LPPSAIYSGNGNGSPTALINTSAYQFTDITGKTYNSGIFFSPAINNSGTTAFAGAGYDFGSAQVNASGPTAIISSTNGAINTVAYSSTPSLPLLLILIKVINDLSNQLAIGSFVSEPGINNQGTVVYLAGYSDGTSTIHARSSSGVTTNIASTSGNRGASHFGRSTSGGKIERNIQVAHKADDTRKQARLQACLRELAGILYEETNLAEVSNLESIEKTVRSHMLKHVSPEIAIFIEQTTGIKTGKTRK
jgi:hypothetical protein